jgi:hypothetical protein
MCTDRSRATIERRHRYDSFQDENSQVVNLRDQLRRSQGFAPNGEQVKELMAEKSRLLSKAQAFADMGLGDTARLIWSCAASFEERIAPLPEMNLSSPVRFVPMSAKAQNDR